MFLCRAILVSLLIVTTSYAQVTSNSQPENNQWQAASPQIILNAPLPSLTSSNVSNNPNQSKNNPATSSTPRNHGAPILSTTINSPDASVASFKRIGQSARRFSLEFFSKFSDIVHQYKPSDRINMMISPFAVWSLLMLIAEGAGGNSFNEMRKGLYIEDNLSELRKAFSEVQRFLKIKTSTIEVASMQALFTDRNKPVNNDYINIIERYYGSEIIDVDFQKPDEAADFINKAVLTATRGLLPNTILPQELKDANLFLLSALFFKGQWKYPFDPLLTRSEPFYDEYGNITQEVQMMVQIANFRFAGITELEGHVLELPYGQQDRLSMLIILPKRGVSLNKVVHNIQTHGTEFIFNKITEASEGNEEEDVEVIMPKFSTEHHYSIVPILNQMGIIDVFSSKHANLSKISDSVFVHEIVHATKIIVDEEGTVAGAVAEAVLANKATPPKFFLNRPFVYLIVEKTTNVVLFAGELYNPNVKYTV